jgi:hypothetical protein
VVTYRHIGDPRVLLAGIRTWLMSHGAEVLRTRVHQVKRAGAAIAIDTDGTRPFHTDRPVIAHEEHQAMLEWIGYPFDSRAFDLNAVNQRLARIKP